MEHRKAMTKKKPKIIQASIVKIFIYTLNTKFPRRI